MAKSAIADALIKTLATGLRRKGMSTCSKWAEKCRIIGKPIPGPFTFKYHPWSREMHDIDDEWCGQKAAQVGFTEVALNRTFFTIDIKRADCLYVLPAKTPDASDFSSARFDAALELSPYLANLFSDVKNIGHKRAGSANLYIRGSRSKSGLKSIPVSLLVLDELEEMTEKNIPLATERLSGQMSSQLIRISTPRIAGHGINVVYTNSTQEFFSFKCPSCSRFIDLVFPDNLVITAEGINDPRIKDSHLICKECKATLHHETKHEWLAKGIWVAGFAGRAIRGFHINQLYSSANAASPVRFVEAYFRSLTDPHEEQEFHNSKLGDVHEPKGARLTEAEILDCVKTYTTPAAPRKHAILTMGVDQGARKLHFEVNEWIFGSTGNDLSAGTVAKIIDFGIVPEPDELDRLMERWGIMMCVIDAHPEKRMALSFAARFFGRVKLCYYVEGANGKVIKEATDEPTVSVDRTAWLDQSLGRFRNQTIVVPLNIGSDYKQQMVTPVRIPEKDKNGNSIHRYVTADNVADHFAHSRNYAEIALPLALKLGQSQNMSSPR